MDATRFKNRAQAGAMLVEKLSAYANRADVIVLGLPRGGVPVAAALAERLNVALDIFLVRKLGVPGHEEYAMGALASGGWRVLNDEVISGLNIGAEAIDAATRREAAELERREKIYRGAAALPTLNGRVVILVDDGLATGASMRVAARAVKQQRPQRLIIAVPVGAPQSCEEMRSEADEVICFETPEAFYAVGQWYEDFSQTGDEEVIASLRQAERRLACLSEELRNECSHQ
jgi:predicted phosphoribosyltransferase